MFNKSNQVKTTGEEIESLPFESDYYSINNEHSLTAKDDDNYSNKAIQKNYVAMTENKEPIIKMNSIYEKTLFTTKQESEDILDLKDINNNIFSTQKNSSNQQAPKEQNDIFHQIQETKYLIDDLKNPNNINDTSNINKIVKNTNLIFEGIEKNIKNKYISSYNKNSLSDVSLDFKNIYDLTDKKNELLKKLKENIVSLKELDSNCIDNSFSMIIDKGEKENYESDEKLDKIEYEKNTFKNKNNQLLSKKRLLNNKKNKKYNPNIPKSNSRHKKRGRISNEDKEKGFKAAIDNKKRTDNMRKKIYHLFFKSIDIYIHTLIGYINKNANKNYNIFHAVINNSNMKDIDSIKILFDKIILDIFLESVPRRGKTENIKNNNKKIYEIINNYNEYGKEGKILYIIFNMTFRDLLLMYLNNDKSIIDESTGEHFDLDEFKTFDDDFVDFDEKTKDNYKRKALQLNSRLKKKK